MPSPLSPSSSQEIIAISPPLPPPSTSKASSSKISLDTLDGGTTLPKPALWDPPVELRGKMVRAVRAYDERVDIQSGKQKAGKGETERERKRAVGAGRARQTEIMMNTLGKGVNPITNSDLYSRSDHFVSCATGHQQSNRGGGSSGATTYWEVRNAKMAEQAREKTSELFRGCVFYINGSTGPRLSNLQLQHIITSNGGRFTATQNGSNTHIIANGGLSGSKTQKHINGQGGRGASRRAKVVRVEWVLDSLERGIKLSEARYGMIKDPTQNSLLSAWGSNSNDENHVKEQSPIQGSDQ
ncbi:BRCT domain-containing protein [Naematelia encephala]|uniref:BRCT domain-containing protein n=1 Tax=Naematelia encephala TaxID=71784 RepID=A0A1Y2B0B5_9TREE|nr:BRCT domain-containing protein [Naematelia encephala]